MQVRLQKILSAAGIASRRAAETFIQEGRVTVNGQTVTELGTKADPDADDVRVDGRRVKPAQRRRYILLYKPRGYITTRSDPQRRPTVIDLLTKGGVREYVYPVGRLDYESEGLLLLTSDGDLAARLTHPRHGVAREYHARVRGVPDGHELERLSRGILLEGRRTAPAGVTLEKVIDADDGQQAVLSFVIREGRNRQVRDMCDAIGHPVMRLKRVRIGPIVDDRIRPGEFRDLTPREVALLKREGDPRDAAAHQKRDPRESASAARDRQRDPRESASAARKRQRDPRESASAARDRQRDPRPITDQPRTARDARSRGPSASGRPRRG
jgi:23S rRNA pseudouridine2605 synthase